VLVCAFLFVRLALAPPRGVLAVEALRMLVGAQELLAQHADVRRRELARGAAHAQRRHALLDLVGVGLTVAVHHHVLLLEIAFAVALEPAVARHHDLGDHTPHRALQPHRVVDVVGPPIHLSAAEPANLLCPL
jgi:hypothetical protein